ncbi:Ribonuclease J [Candidatus Hepatincola sp. Pdp]
MGKDYKVRFVALGGIGEIGLNCYLYSHVNKEETEHLMVDCGVSFRDTKLTSAEIFMPDITYLSRANTSLAGIVITHGHEDHIGALPYLLDKLGFPPVYATPWTASLIEAKLKETNILEKATVIPITTKQEYHIGSFKVKWIPTYHSILENTTLVITTAKGKIIHSGDVKLHYNNPDIMKNYENLALEKAEYLFCDSTNVRQKGIAGDEASLYEDFYKLIASAKSVCWVTLFASNLERVRLIAQVAQKLKKRIVLFGRSLETYTKIGLEHGYLDSNFFISEKESESFPRNKLIFLVTGSQGEVKSALSSIVSGKHRQKFHEDDIVLFASKIIPGNELKVFKYYNLLSEQDITYYTAYDYNIHVSGHATKKELAEIYKYVNPKYVIPIHGEALHIKAAMELAWAEGFNSEHFFCGEVVELFEGEPQVIEQIEVGKLVFEGNRIASFSEEFFRERTKVFYEGTAFVTIGIDNHKIHHFHLDIIGLVTPLEHELFSAEIKYRVESYLQGNNLIFNNHATEIAEEIRVITRKYIASKLGKKPIVKVHVIKI